MPCVRSFTVMPALPKALKDLEVIAKNMFWSWNPEFVELFRRIDSDLWLECGHNPVKMLGCITQEKIDELSENQGVLVNIGLQIKAAKFSSITPLKLTFEKPVVFKKNQIAVILKPESPTIRIIGSGKIK